MHPTRSSRIVRRVAHSRGKTLANAALAALSAERALRVGSVIAADAASPGLYAFYAADATWRSLGLSTSPDERPLYVGKAENTFASRDLQGHFGMRPRGVQSPTGSSTLRRSLAALLAPERGYRGMPRNPEKPGHYSNFGLSPADDEDLSAWMRRRLRLALWPHADVDELDQVETLVVTRLVPPLNLDKVVTPWMGQVKAARKVLAQQARDWRPK